MLIQAPAKINLTLRILSKRADGYHELSSEMQAIRLYDEVELELGGGEEGIKVSAGMEGVPEGSKNLAWRAAELAFKTWGVAPNVNIVLRKNIPVAAGLAGGSTDAAAVLLGLAKKLRPEAKIEEIATLGAKVGADVPFCVYSNAAANPGLGYKGAGLALAEGIGDRITPLPGPLRESKRAMVLLVKPGIEVSTKEIFDLYDREPIGPKRPDSTQRNDLGECCFMAYPVVREVYRKVLEIRDERSEGRLRSMIQLTGSGPTIIMYIPLPAMLVTENGAFIELKGAECEEAIHYVYTRVREAFPSMFVHLSETL